MAFRRVFSVQWHLTDECDQRCDHCYIYQGNKVPLIPARELSLAQCLDVVDDFVRFCAAMECDPAVSITGGDPLLSPHVWEVLEALQRTGIRFSVLGNPFHLKKERCERLAALGCRSYQMSLDGLEATHDGIRNNSGSYQQTVQALPLLRAAGIQTAIMTTVSRTNYREIPQLIRDVVALGVNTYAFARYCPTNGDAGLNLTPEEYRQVLTDAWAVYEELADRGTVFPLKDHLWTLWLSERGLFMPGTEKVICEGCNCAIRHMAVLADGTVYACRRFVSPVGKVPEQRFMDIFLGQAMNAYRQYDRFEGCRSCPLLNYCRGCPAVAYGTFGNFYAKDPQCWRAWQTA